MDYDDDDFTGPGYYRVTYGGDPRPDGPHQSIRALAEATDLTDYPDNGYVVHWTGPGEMIGSVPSLNPDDLVRRTDTVTLELTGREVDALRHWHETIADFGEVQHATGVDLTRVLDKLARTATNDAPHRG